MGNNSSSHDISESAGEVDKKQKKKKHHKRPPSREQQPLDQKPAESKQPPLNPQPAASISPYEEAKRYVMLSYSRANEEFLNKMSGLLKQHKIRTWNDTADIPVGTDFLRNIGQAIIDCDIFMYLITEDSIKSKYCQDELALAYISNKLIIPVSESPPQELFPIMDTGTKLQLARMRWFVFNTPDNSMKASEAMTDVIKEHFESNTPVTNQKRLVTRTMSYPDDDGEADGIEDEEFMASFWERHFEEQTSVSWPDFIEKFSHEYKKDLDMIFKESKNKVWLMAILQNELNVQKNQISRIHYDSFCMTEQGRKPFWIRVQEHAVEHYTIREVFNMESSVRVEAIENLGKFKSPSVIEALLDLLRDEDNNVKAVAAISLARTETESEDVQKRLMATLEDKDRLVRESGCLALGHLKAKVAVAKLVHLWRNDFISSVRDAAELALEQIGGDEANKAIHMTRVLTDEIKQLMTS